MNSSAHAQYAGGNSSTEEKIDEEFRISLFPEDTYGIAFFHEPHKSEKDFTLRLFYYNTVAGCAHMEDLTKEEDQEKYNFVDGIATKIVSGIFEVIISQPSLIDSDDHPRYTNYDCETKHNDSYVDLKLDRDFLIRKKIKKMGFKNIHTADFGDFDIDINEQRFILKTPSQEGEIWYKLWFFPKNTVVLMVPQAKLGVDVKSDLKDFAMERGLVPLEDVLDGYQLPANAHNYMFFDDPKGVFASKLSEENNSLNAGTITAMKTYYGPGGTKQEPFSMDVIAKLPLVLKTQEY